MVIERPSEQELIALLGEERLRIGQAVCQLIEQYYDMETLWSTGGKNWQYEYKYRRGGKTLCALYVREGTLGWMIILGQAEREKFEAQRAEFSPFVQEQYDKATTYHDGKWLMLELADLSLLDDLPKLLMLKRRPNKKAVTN